MRGLEEEAEGFGGRSSSEAQERNVCIDLADRFCFDSYYSFYPSPASSSSRSPRARLFLPFKKKLAEPASRSQLARCLYRLAWNGMSRKSGKKRAIPRGRDLRSPLSLIIINGDDRQFRRYFLRLSIFTLNWRIQYLFKRYARFIIGNI